MVLDKQIKFRVAETNIITKLSLEQISLEKFTHLQLRHNSQYPPSYQRYGSRQPGQKKFDFRPLQYRAHYGKIQHYNISEYHNRLDTTSKGEVAANCLVPEVKNLFLLASSAYLILISGDSVSKFFWG